MLTEGPTCRDRDAGCIAACSLGACPHGLLFRHVLFDKFLVMVFAVWLWDDGYLILEMLAHEEPP